MFRCNFVISVGMQLFFVVKIWINVLVCFECLIFVFVGFLGWSEYEYGFYVP